MSELSPGRYSSLALPDGPDLAEQALRYVDEVTGEVIETEPAAPISLSLMTGYALAKTAGDAAQLQLAERMAELLRSDPEACQLQAEIERHRVTTTAVEAGLEGAFSPEVRRALGSGISLDVGFVRITWPKPAARWVQDIKPATIAAKDPELAKLLGIEQVVGAPSSPRITIRAEKLAGVR